MKAFIVSFIAIIGFSAAAQPQQRITCLREILAGALAEDVKNSTLDVLQTHDYSVVDFNAALGSMPSYEVEVEKISRLDKSTMTSMYQVVVKDLKTCTVSVDLLAD